MRFRWLSEYWQGLLLAMSGIVASVWFAATGKLDLYIHPRYIWFTTLMSCLALAVLVLEFWRRPQPKKHTASQPVVTVALSCVCLVVGVSLLVTKPAALSSSTANQRGINAASLDLSAQTSNVAITAGTDYSRFSIRDWASLLGQSTGPELFAGKQVHVIGFVSPVDGSPNMFYVSRFVITCCAIDARPIGVPVYLPEWQSTYKDNEWVEVSGVFAKHPNTGTAGVAIQPNSISKVSQPSDPYGE